LKHTALDRLQVRLNVILFKLYSGCFNTQSMPLVTALYVNTPDATDANIAYFTGERLTWFQVANLQSTNSD